jgi:hypothetical protein
MPKVGIVTVGNHSSLDADCFSSGQEADYEPVAVFPQEREPVASIKEAS